MNFKFNRKPLKEKIYKWYVCGYYDINARGVEDNLTTNDVEEAKDFAWELVNRGDFVIVKNMHNGKSAIINEDDAFDDVSEYLNDIFRSIDGRTNEAFQREEIVLNFDRALLDKWIDRLNQHDARYDKKYYYTEGGKYIKVIYTYGGHDLGSVFAFVDADGNIYKPAGWNAPAKGVRARIDDNPPVDGKDLYAPRYRKAVYGESLKEDISDYEIDKAYKKLSKLNKVDFGALEDEYLKTRPSLKDAVYKFYGTILNTKSYCKDFVKWAKEEKGIDLKGLPCKESYRRRVNEDTQKTIFKNDEYIIKQSPFSVRVLKYKTKILDGVPDTDYHLVLEVNEFGAYDSLGRSYTLRDGDDPISFAKRWIGVKDESYRRRVK